MKIILPFYISELLNYEYDNHIISTLATQYTLPPEEGMLFI
jgi:hypothetical protein